MNGGRLGFEPGRIGVFRALMLGDLLCAVPALRALKGAYPKSEIMLIGLPWARELAQRLSMVDGFIEFPGFPGLPEVPVDVRKVPIFMQEMQRQEFDLLVQMHGSGSIVNPLLACFGARRMAGFVEASGAGAYSADPELHTLWPEEGHEIERMLRLTDHLGLPRLGTALEFPVTAKDHGELADLWPGCAQPYVCVHPGSQLPSRRWPPERFAQVADELAGQGLQVVLTGSKGEADLVARVQGAMKAAAVNLAGRTSPWTLGALIERARLLVSNDTGVSHIAAALRTPSVIVSSGADVARWAPLDRERHQVLWQPMACRPCGYRECPVGHGCSTGVAVERVVDAALSRLAHLPL